MASGRHCVLTEGVFTLYPRKKPYLVTLKRSSLTYSPLGNEWGEINNGSYHQTAPLTNSSWDPVINNSTDQNNDAVNSTLANNSGDPTAVTSAQQTLTPNVGPNNQPQGYHNTNNNQKNNHNNNYNDYNNHYDENKRPVGDSIHLSDVVGCHCFKGKTLDDPRAYFTVYAYPFKKKILSGRKIRHRISVTFGVSQFEIFENNLRIAEKWKNLIVYLARGKPMLNLEDIENIPVDTAQKMLILINPYSGSGKSLKLFQQQVAPMFGEADIHYKILVTKYAGHAQEYVQTLDLSRWYGIVVMSGDGLMFEVINGLMARPDWQKALKIPIGCIPAGSGNALCCSINYSAGEPILSNDVLHSTFVLLKHQVLPLDLVAIQMQNKSMYSFLSVTWGIIADIDYESEKYRRSLGSKRFLVLFAQRIIDLRSYRGRLSFIPIMAFPDNCSGEDAKVRKLSRFVLDSNPGSCDNSLSGSDCQLDAMDDCSWSSSGNGLPKRSYTLPEGFNLKDKKEYNENLPRNSRHHSENDLSLELNHSSHRNLSFNSCHDVSNSSYLIRNGNTKANPEPFQNTSTSRHSNSGRTAQDCVHLKSQQMVTADNVIIKEETMTVRKGEIVPTPLLPPLDEDVPSNWVVIEDNFISMSASYQTHLGPDFLAAPDSRFNDGIIHLHFIRAGVSRNTLFGLFRAVEDASHLDSPFVETVKVLAFRLEPLDKTGNIMVDGEHVEYGAIQGQVLPGVANIMGIQ